MGLAPLLARGPRLRGDDSFIYRKQSVICRKQSRGGSRGRPSGCHPPPARASIKLSSPREAGTSGRKRRAADIGLSGREARPIWAWRPFRPEVPAFAGMTVLYIGNRALYMGNRAVAARAGIHQVVILRLRGRPSSCHPRLRGDDSFIYRKQSHSGSCEHPSGCHPPPARASIKLSSPREAGTSGRKRRAADIGLSGREARPIWAWRPFRPEVPASRGDDSFIYRKQSLIYGKQSRGGSRGRPSSCHPPPARVSIRLSSPREAGTSGRKRRAADIGLSGREARPIWAWRPFRPEVPAFAGMTVLYMGNRALYMGNSAVAARVGIHQVVILRLRGHPSGCHPPPVRASIELSSPREAGTSGRKRRAADIGLSGREARPI